MGRSGRDGAGRRAAARGAVAVLALTAGLCACGRAAPAPSAHAASGDAGFLPPPTLESADWTAAGGVSLAGRAPPDAVVRLQAPDGRALGVTADSSGGWTAELPPASAPELFALSAEVAGRTVRAEGALAAAPPGSTAAALVARAGAASATAGSATPGGPPALEAIDFDRGGGLAAAGRAAAGATLKLSVDGAAVGAGRADALGRFGLTGVGAPLKPGLHEVRVETQGAAVEAQVDTSAATPLAGVAFRAARAASGWRVDWAPPGGGVQSLLWLDAPAATPGGRVRP